MASAGKAGANTELYVPANYPYVLTVGASDGLGSVSALDDTSAWLVLRRARGAPRPR